MGHFKLHKTKEEPLLLLLQDEETEALASDFREHVGPHKNLNTNL